MIKSKTDGQKLKLMIRRNQNRQLNQTAKNENLTAFPNKIIEKNISKSVLSFQNVG